MPDEREFLCGDWVWDAALRELRHYPRKRKGHAEQPDAVERVEPAQSVTLYRWSQSPMQTSTGEVMPPSLARVEVLYADGRKLTLNETDRHCAQLLATTVAAAYGVPVREEGAPSGRRRGNLPQRDSMGRWRTMNERTESVLDESVGEITVTRRKRLFGKERRSLRTSEIRRLEMGYAVRGPTETFTVWAVVGADEERVPVAAYSGMEGWAEPEEWREFTRTLAQSIGVPAVVPETLSPGA